MRIAYLDCFSGISGDMFLGALVDAGVPFEPLQKTVTGLTLGAVLEHTRVERSGIAATKIDVVVHGEKDLPREEFWSQQHQPEPAEHHQHRHEHHHAHEPHEHKSAGHQPTQRRGLSEILSLIAAAAISDTAKHTASEIFRVLGQAEAKIHNTDIENVHFHEIGAEDAIVDIVCAAVAAEALGVEKFFSSPLNVGSGAVACAHGVLPVPAPATLEILRGVPIYSGDIQKEMVTPTGAAIARVLVSNFAPRPPMSTDSIGYGAGTRDFPGHPNVLRITVGEALSAHASPHLHEEEIAILEANLDDLNPQLIGYLAERAFEAGALDVFTAPVQMKKSRPGTVFTVLANPHDEARLRELIFRESSTLGVRVRHEKRYALPRRHESVTTPWGEVRIKLGGVNGAAWQYAPEYEDCRRLAAEHDVPLKTVMQEAIRRYLDQKAEQTMDQKNG
jgi:uncharacterized protein (TIGR00299 family) protein